MNLIRGRVGIIFVIACLVLALALAFFFSEKYINSQSVKPQVVNMTGDLVESFATVDEMKIAAQIIVEGHVMSTKTIKYGNVVFTLSDIMIERTHKGMGEITTNTITVLQTGGTYEEKTYLFEENEVFRTNDHAILFLKEYRGPIVKDAYVILGEFQGKFLVVGDKVIPSKGVNPGLEWVRRHSDLKL